MSAEDLRQLAATSRRSPHLSLSVASSATLVLRTDPVVDLDLAVLMCDSLRDACMVCLSKTHEYRCHQGRPCPLLRGRCLRCFEKNSNHNVRNCPLQRSQCRTQERSCARCGFAHKGTWGSKCETGLELLRDLALSLWLTQPEWLLSKFPWAAAATTTAEKIRLLYESETPIGSARILRVCLKWHDRFTDQRRGRQQAG